MSIVVDENLSGVEVGGSHELDERVDAVGSILLIGDSIMIGMAPRYISELSDATVSGPIVNARNTVFTLENIESWLTTVPNPDFVLWNNGLWHCITTTSYVQSASSYQTTDAQYESDVIEIGTRLLDEGSRVFFVETTNIPTAASAVYNVEKELDLNNIARRVLKPIGIDFLEIRQQGLINTSTYRTSQDDPHFNTTGYYGLTDSLIAGIFK